MWSSQYLLEKEEIRFLSAHKFFYKCHIQVFIESKTMHFWLFCILVHQLLIYQSISYYVFTYCKVDEWGSNTRRSFSCGINSITDYYMMNVLNEWKCDVSKMIKAVRYKNKSWILQDTEKNTEKGDMFCVLFFCLCSPCPQINWKVCTVIKVWLTVRH